MEGGKIVNGKSNKGRIAFFISLAVNIFLIAFTLGRISVPGFMPPHLGMEGRHFGPPPGLYGEMPPHFMHEGPHGGPPPRPPFFGPADLFSPEEMQTDALRMQESFNKIDGLRRDFANQLNANPLTKEDVLKHFSSIDQIENDVKKKMQEKAAAKISSMSPDERHRFANALLGKPE
jgi:hypothetical protein